MLAPQAYLEITGSFNLSRGATLAIVLLIPSLTAFAIQRSYLAKRQYITVTGKPSTSTSKIVSVPVKWVLYGIVVAFALLVVAFYAVILTGAFTKVWGFNYAPDAGPFRLCLRRRPAIREGHADRCRGLDAGQRLARDAGGVPGSAADLSRPHRPGVRRHPALRRAGHGGGHRLHPRLQRAAARSSPAPSPSSVLCFVFRYMPVGIQSGIAVLRQIDPSIEEAAQNLGADGLTTFRKVTLPLIAPAFFSGLVYAFVRAMTAISAAIFLVSANWNLMTVQILNQVGSGRLGVAAAFSVLVIVIVLIAIGLIGAFVDRWSQHTAMVRHA